MTSRLGVTVHAIKALKLTTFRAEHFRSPWEPADVKDSFVRIYPPVNATDEEVKDLKERLLAAGAKSVRTMPKPSAHGVVKAPEASSPREHKTVRQTILAMVEESHSTDRDELRKIVSRTMDRVGL